MERFGISFALVLGKYQLNNVIATNEKAGSTDCVCDFSGVYAIKSLVVVVLIAVKDTHITWYALT